MGEILRGAPDVWHRLAFQDPNKSYPRGLRGQLTLAAADLRWRFGLRILSLIMSAIILGNLANLSRAFASAVHPFASAAAKSGPTPLLAWDMRPGEPSSRPCP